MVTALCVLESYTNNATGAGKQGGELDQKRHEMRMQFDKEIGPPNKLGEAARAQ
jgi:hypothetical protein